MKDGFHHTLIPFTCPIWRVLKSPKRSDPGAGRRLFAPKPQLGLRSP